MTEDRRQKTEDREQKRQNRGQKIDKRIYVGRGMKGGVSSLIGFLSSDFCRLFSVLCLFLLAALLVPLRLLADEEFMGVGELKPGMEGIGKTVFKGTKVENFDVEVLGVLKNVWPRGDLILIRLKGSFLKETGVIAGMSGSPIYIEGKLIGALAYGWSFSKEAIAGVTPIKDMLSVYVRVGKSSRSWNQPLTVGSSQEAISLKPLPSPLTLSGFDPQVINEMEPTLNRLGFLVTQGGGGAALERKNVPLVPGSAMGVPLIRGDLNATAIGTLTYRRGNKILAFGHPMFFGGTTDLPLSGAYIYTVLPSVERSFKLGSATRTVGRITQDRRAAIAGEVGRFARMIPFEVKIKRKGKEEDYKFEIIHNRLLTPVLLQGAASNVILTAARRAGETSFSSSLTIYLKGKKPITFENSYSNPVSVLPSVRELTKPLKLLMGNAFREVEVEKVSLEVKIREVRKTAEIFGLRLNKNKVRPGESFEVMVILKPFEEALTIKTIKLTVPRDTPDGELMITASDALTARREEEKRAPYKFRPKNLDRLIRLMEERNKNTEVIIRLILPKGGAVISGEELPALPESVLAVMSTTPEAGLGGITTTTKMVEKKLSTGWVISPGTYSLPLMVQNKFGD